jgi:MFS family permease
LKDSFRTYWLGQGVSNLGDAFAFVAIPLLVLDATGSVAQMGLVTALQAAAQVAAALLAGSAVDRADRRRLMIACDAGRGLLLLGLGLAWLAGLRSMALVYSVAVAAAALGNTFLVASVAAVTNIVGRDRLTTANSRLQATQALAFVIGPALAGVVVARFGVAQAVLIDAGSFAVSVASLVSIRFHHQRADRVAGEGMLAGLRAGLRFMLGQPVLAAMTGVMTVMALLSSGGLGAGVIDLLIFHLRHELGRSERVVGLCLGLAALGALAGAITAPLLRRRAGFAACFVGGTAAQGLGLFVIGAFRNTSFTALGACLWCAGLTTRAVNGISMRQALVPDALLGRVTAASWTVIFAASAVGTAGISRLAAAFGTAPVFTATGLLVTVVATGAAFTPIRGARA